MCVGQTLLGPVSGSFPRTLVSLTETLGFVVGLVYPVFIKSPVWVFILVHTEPGAGLSTVFVLLCNIISELYGLPSMTCQACRWQASCVVGFIQLGMRRRIADDSMRVPGGCEQTVRPSAVFEATS